MNEKMKHENFEGGKSIKCVILAKYFEGKSDDETDKILF